MPMRWAAYAGVSTALATGVVLKALHQRANFYSACVYLAQSNANLMILTNFVFLILCAILLALQKLLYGPLRPIEIEQLYEKAWFAVTETCLAMTIFPRGELGGWFLVMFFSLLAGKVWAWIGEGRVEYLEQQPPSNPRLFHTRLATSLALSILFNTYLLEYSVKTVLRQARPDMMVMFGFEFAVLSITSVSTAARYWISLMEIYITRKQKKEIIEERRQEIRRQRAAANTNTDAGTVTTTGAPEDEEIDEMELEVPGWEEKGRWVFYLDLITDFLKLNVYLAFFTILLTFYGLPIHIIRDVFFTCRSFINRIKDFIRYRTATKDMNERYPDATAEEVAAADVCIICREEMTAWPPPPAANNGQVETESRRRMRSNLAERMRPKKLPCGHVLHFSCLRSWLERQQNCPTCRRPVLAERRIGGTGANGADGHAPGQRGNGDANDDNLQNRARIINLGPLRIGFGAGRGNFFNDLAQQVHNGQDQRAPADAAANAGQPQQFGFGLGWNRNQNPDTRRGATSTDIQDQIRALELRLQQEINDLRLAADQMHLIRMMQGELARLRIAGANGTPNAATGSHGTSTAPALPLRPPFPFQTPPFFPSMPQLYNSGAPSTTIPSGSSELPTGLVIPEGWSILPLQRADQSQPPTAAAPGEAGPQVAPNASISPSGTTTAQTPSVRTAIANDTSPSQGGQDAQSSISQPQNSNVLSSSTSAPSVENALASHPEQSIGIDGSSSLPGETVANGASTASGPPSYSDLPSWSFGEEPSGEEPSTEDSTSDQEVYSPTGSVNGEVGGSSGTAGSHKGKGRAATVEDFLDDVD